MSLLHAPMRVLCQLHVDGPRQDKVTVDLFFCHIFRDGADICIFKLRQFRRRFHAVFLRQSCCGVVIVWLEMTT